MTKLFQNECICDTKMVHRPISPGPLRLMCLRLVSQVVQIFWILQSFGFSLIFCLTCLLGVLWMGLTEKSWKQQFSIKKSFSPGDLQLPRMPSSSGALLAPVWSHSALHSCKADRVSFPTWILIFLTNEVDKISYRLFQKVRPSILTAKPEGSSAWVPHTALVRQTAQDEAENNW